MAIPGWQSLIVCTGAQGSNPCDFRDLVTLVDVLINNMVVISTLLVVAVFIWAGLTLITAGGKPGALDKAKGMFWNVILGYLWILAAWVIVNTITSVLLKDDFSLIGGA